MSDSKRTARVTKGDVVQVKLYVNGVHVDGANWLGPPERALPADVQIFDRDGDRLADPRFDCLHHGFALRYKDAMYKIGVPSSSSSSPSSSSSSSSSLSSSSSSGGGEVKARLAAVEKAIAFESKILTPLGMQSGEIRDDQISASSEHDPNHSPKGGRLHRTEIQGAQAWCAKANDLVQWFQVNLLAPHIISAIAIQGRGDSPYSNQRVTSFIVKYSHNGSVWTDYAGGKLLDGTSRELTVHTEILTPRIHAQYIRIYPRSWENHMSMRIELYGGHAEE